MVLRERESIQCEFDQGDPERPDVRLDGMLYSLNTFRLHIMANVLTVSHPRVIGSKKEATLTFIQGNVPAKVSVVDLISSPDAPRSQILS